VQRSKKTNKSYFLIALKDTRNFAGDEPDFEKGFCSDLQVTRTSYRTLFNLQVWAEKLAEPENEVIMHST